MARQTSYASHYVTQYTGAPVSHSAARVGGIRVPAIWAHNVVLLNQHQGAYVEVIGKVVNIVRRITKDGNPYVFINFGDWRQGCFRLVFWSEALDSFEQHGLDPQVLTGMWLSVQGILEVYQGSSGVKPPQIAPGRPEQLTVFGSEAEAKQQFSTATANDSPAPPQVIAKSEPVTPAPPKPATQPVCSYCAEPVRTEAKICSQCGSPRYPLTRLCPGDLLNSRYTIKRALSRGGMGEIYLAVDGNVFGRHVVIKVMLDYFDTGDAAEVQAAQQMFEREAQTLATLSHPAIPKIHDRFQLEADAFIVMEYIAGDNLETHLTHADMAQRRVPGQPYPVEVGVRYGLEIARVLQYLAAIESGSVVHHDIKPANVLLDPTGMIRLVDFGTARPQIPVKGNVQHAGQSAVYGTPGYAPPEQYRGRTEPRSDVYALAATIYHLVTDDDPRLHPFSFPRLSQLGRFGEVLTRALSERVDLRPDAHAFAEELQQIPTRVAAEEAQRQAQIDVAQRKAQTEAQQRQAQIDADRRKLEAEKARVEAERARTEEDSRQRQAQIDAAQRQAQTEVQQRQAQIDADRRKLEAEKARVEAERARAEEDSRQQAERARLRCAPDGTPLFSTDDLLRWSERHWQSAVAWLEDEQKFLQQIEAICGAEVESTLRVIVCNSSADNKNHVLDTILAQLDPQGFGLEQAQIVVDRTKISLNFGEIPLHTERRIAVMVKNTSRRYVKLEIAGPTWLRLDDSAVDFLPGTEHEVAFIAQVSEDTSLSATAGTAKVLVNGRQAGIVRVKASLPWRGIFARLR